MIPHSISSFSSCWLWKFLQSSPQYMVSNPKKKDRFLETEQNKWTMMIIKPQPEHANLDGNKRPGFTGNGWKNPASHGELTLMLRHPQELSRPAVFTKKNSTWCVVVDVVKLQATDFNIQTRDEQFRLQHDRGLHTQTIWSFFFLNHNFEKFSSNTGFQLVSSLSVESVHCHLVRACDLRDEDQSVSQSVTRTNILSARLRTTATKNKTTFFVWKPET